MQMLIAGEWVDGAGSKEVTSPYTGETIDTVPSARPDDVERALAAAVEGARQMARLTAYERARCSSVRPRCWTTGWSRSPHHLARGG